METNRFVCYVLVGDQNGHIGLGQKCAKEVATAIRGGIIAAKMNLIPVRRGYWGNKLGVPHTVPMKVHGKCGSVRVRLVPAPRGSGVRLTDIEEDDEFCGSGRLLLLFFWAHPNQGQ